MLKLRRIAGKIGLNKIQTVKNIALRKLTDMLLYISSCALHKDFKITSVHDKIKLLFIKYSILPCQFSF